MYYCIVAALMFVLPLLSIAADASGASAAALMPLVGKWFVFWAVGVRLSLAGLRQIVQPRYTAKHILGIEGDDVLLVVRELGFANLSIGMLGVASLMAAGWVVPAALAGGLFYGLAGVNHARQPNRNRLENVAMVSDLFVAAVLLGFCTWVGLR